MFTSTVGDRRAAILPTGQHTYIDLFIIVLASALDGLFTIYRKSRGRRRIVGYFRGIILPKSHDFKRITFRFKYFLDENWHSIL